MQEKDGERVMQKSADGRLIVGKFMGAQGIQAKVGSRDWDFFEESDLLDDLEFGRVHDLSQEQAEDVCNVLDAAISLMVQRAEEYSDKP